MHRGWNVFSGDATKAETSKERRRRGGQQEEGADFVPAGLFQDPSDEGLSQTSSPRLLRDCDRAEQGTIAVRLERRAAHESAVSHGEQKARYMRLDPGQWQVGVLEQTEYRLQVFDGCWTKVDVLQGVFLL